MTDVSVASELLNAALDGGINFLDTAACYGRSEEWIGRTISHRRQEYVLATKAGHVVEGYAGEEWTAQTILDSIERMGVIAKRPIANAAWGAPASSDLAREDYRQAAQAMLEVGSLPGTPDDPVLLALGFVLAHQEVDTTIVGTSSPDHMRANIRLAERELPLPVKVVQELHRRYDQLKSS